MGVFLDYIGLQVVRNERETVSLGLGVAKKGETPNYRRLLAPFMLKTDLCIHLWMSANNIGHK